MIAGIICEYNPLHLGHVHLLQQVRKAGADTIVCAMSGNFVQRGEPALIRKHLRAAAAIDCGADLVLEIPTPWAMATAEIFARGGAKGMRERGVPSSRRARKGKAERRSSWRRYWTETI